MSIGKIDLARYREVTIETTSVDTKQVSEPTFYHVPISSWPVEERPREKLLHRGAGILTDAELLAILIRMGSKGVTAVDLARRLFSGERTLHEISLLSVEEIKKIGIGESRAVAIAAAFELAKRLPETKRRERLAIQSPEDIVQRFGAKFRDLGAGRIMGVSVKLYQPRS